MHRTYRIPALVRATRRRGGGKEGRARGGPASAGAALHRTAPGHARACQGRWACFQAALCELWCAGVSRVPLLPLAARASPQLPECRALMSALFAVRAARCRHAQQGVHAPRGETPAAAVGQAVMMMKRSVCGTFLVCLGWALVRLQLCNSVVCWLVEEYRFFNGVRRLRCACLFTEWAARAGRVCGRFGRPPPRAVVAGPARSPGAPLSGPPFGSFARPPPLQF